MAVAELSLSNLSAHELSRRVSLAGRALILIFGAVALGTVLVGDASEVSRLWLHAVRLSALGALLVLGARTPNGRMTAPAAVVAGGVVCWTAAAMGILRGESSSALLVGMGMMMVSAPFLPWGPLYQLGLASMALSAAAVCAQVVHGNLFAVASPSVLAGVGLLAAGSVLGASELRNVYQRRCGFSGVARGTDEGTGEIANEVARDLEVEIERRVAERTVALQRSNDELKHFAHAVSHDLRAPLRTISGYAATVADDYSGALGEDATRMLGRIQNGAVSMSGMLDGLMALGQISRDTVHRDVLQPSDVAREIISGICREMGDAAPKFVVFETPQVVADHRMLRVLLENLLRNAAKFSGGADEPVVELGTVYRDGVMAYFIRDNGVGFPAEEATAIFEPFRRAHAGKGFEGSGLGLATAEKIVSRHSGKIWAESRPRRGATFFFTLEPSAAVGGSASEPPPTLH